ncbi:MAG: hypothetical protein NXI16_01100 [Alphaproteobacteria bacterium]|nr:hypothetical protein [Alphaproteobacteria bacterium]
MTEKQCLTVLADAVTDSIGLHPVVASIKMAVHTGAPADYQAAQREFDGLPKHQKIEVSSTARSRARDIVEMNQKESDTEEVGFLAIEELFKMVSEGPKGTRGPL